MNNVLDQQKILKMLTHLWRKGGCSPTRIFSSPCTSSIIVTNDEVEFQEEAEEQDTYALQEEVSYISFDQFPGHIQEPWTSVEEEKPFEP